MTIELSKEEFAYLLAAVEATSLIGVEDPKLFPADARSRKTIYRKGREQLEANGWLTPLEDHQDEHELNADLFHLTAAVAEASYVLGTSVGATKKGRRWLLHYLAGEHIIELWLTQAKSYAFRVVPDRESLIERVAEVLEVDHSTNAVTLTLDEKTFKKIVNLASKGQEKQASELLETNGKVGSSIIQALSGKARAQISLVQASVGEIQVGRRASVYGTGKAPWMVWREDEESEQLNIAACDADHLSQLLSKWIEQFPS